MIQNRSFETYASAGAAVTLAAVVAGVDPVLAFLVGVLAGVAVEAIQWVFPRTGSPSWADVIYTAIGALAGALWAILF
jgi:VanZ family protein